MKRIYFICLLMLGFSSWVDLGSCSGPQILDCTFDVGDDGICIKSGRNEQGRKKGKPTENVVIQNSAVYHAHGGILAANEMEIGNND